MSWYHGFEIGARYLEILVWPFLTGAVLWGFRDSISKLLEERDLEFPTPMGPAKAAAPDQPEPEPDDVEEASELATEAEEVTEATEEPEGMTVEEARRRIEDERLRGEVAQLKLHLFYERTVQWIFGSQLGFLMELAEDEAQHASVGEIAEWYFKYKVAATVSGTDPMSQEQWLQYLSASNLVRLERQTHELEGLMTVGVDLTPLGEDFVRYCGDRGYTPDKFMT